VAHLHTIREAQDIAVRRLANEIGTQAQPIAPLTGFDSMHAVRWDAPEPIRNSRRDECAKNGARVTRTGGFCLPYGSKARNVSIGGNALYDKRMAHYLAQHIFENATVVDLGAGLGHYGKIFQEPGSPVRAWAGYDGALNVEDVTDGLVRFMDLTQPDATDARPCVGADWVMSLEVAEHIPPPFTDAFLRNVRCHARVGAVISWALPSQTGGLGHVNMRDEADAQASVQRWGFHVDHNATTAARAASTLPWFKKSISVYRLNADDEPRLGERLHRRRGRRRHGRVRPTFDRPHQNRRQSQHRLLEAAPLSNERVSAVPDLHVNISWNLCRDRTMVPESAAMLAYEAVSRVDAMQIPGAIVEAGVWMGGMSCFMAMAHRGQERHLWLYDTFAGMSPPTAEKDGARAVELFASLNRSNFPFKKHVRDGKWCYGSLTDVRATMARTLHTPSHVHYIEGKVEETLRNQSIELPLSISILRLDTDFYDSTKMELDVLWPRLSPGGWLYLDDYGNWAGARAAVDEWLEKNHWTHHAVAAQAFPGPDNARRFSLCKHIHFSETKPFMSCRKPAHPTPPPLPLLVNNIQQAVLAPMQRRVRPTVAHMLTSELRAPACEKGTLRCDRALNTTAPILSIIGFQKCATSFVRNTFRKMHRTCVAEGETPYWARVNAAWERPSCPQVQKHYLSRAFPCIATADFAFEKSPTLVAQPWAAKRMCELVPNVRIAAIVRDPVTRAHSAFVQCWDWIRNAPTIVHGWGSRGQPPDHPTPKLFHELVELEVAIVTECGVTSSTGNFQVDWPAAVNFSRCCTTVAMKHGHSPWPGCDAYGVRKPLVHQPPKDLWATRSHRIPASRGLGWTLTPFGGYCLDFVRGGLYFAQLRPWAELYGAGAILVMSLAELKRAPVAAMQRLVRHAVGSTLMDAEVNRVLEHHDSRPHNSLINSKRFDSALPGAVQPQNRTLALLTRFYRASKLALEIEFGVVPADS